MSMISIPAAEPRKLFTLQVKPSLDQEVKDMNLNEITYISSRITSYAPRRFLLCASPHYNASGPVEKPPREIA